MKKAEGKNNISLCSMGEKLLLAQLGNCQHGPSNKKNNRHQEKSHVAFPAKVGDCWQPHLWQPVQQTMMCVA